MKLKIFKLLFLYIVVVCFFLGITWANGISDVPKFTATKVAGLSLLDSKSTLKVFGNTLQLYNSEFGFAYYKYLNQSETEIITLISHPGAIRYSIAEVKVSKASNRKGIPIFPKKNPEFTSDKGVALGMLRSDLTKLLGKPSNGNETFIEYRLEGNSSFLKKYNMPVYYGKYKFDKGKLIEYSFGFEYP